MVESLTSDNGKVSLQFKLSFSHHDSTGQGRRIKAIDIAADVISAGYSEKPLPNNCDIETYKSVLGILIHEVTEDIKVLKRMAGEMPIPSIRSVIESYVVHCKNMRKRWKGLVKERPLFDILSDVEATPIISQTIATYIFCEKYLVDILDKHDGVLHNAIDELESVALSSDTVVQFALPEDVVQSANTLNCIRLVASWSRSNNNELQEKLDTIRAIPSVDERYIVVCSMIEDCEKIAQRFSIIKQKWYDQHKEIVHLWSDVSIHDLTESQKIILLQNLPGLLLYSGDAALGRLSRLNAMKNEIICSKKYIQELHTHATTLALSQDEPLLENSHSTQDIQVELSVIETSPIQTEYLRIKQSIAARIGLKLKEKGEPLYHWKNKQVAELLTKHCRDENGEKFRSLESAMKSPSTRTAAIEVNGSIIFRGREEILFNQVKAIIEVAKNAQ